MKNFTIWKGLGDTPTVAIVTVDGITYTVDVTEEMLQYFDVEGCTCGMIPVEELQRVIVSGSDDCPIHGLVHEGDEHEHQ